MRPVECFARAHAGLVAIVSVAKAGCIACHGIALQYCLLPSMGTYIRARLTADRPEILLTSDCFQPGVVDGAYQSARLDGTGRQLIHGQSAGVPLLQVGGGAQSDAGCRLASPRARTESGLIFADFGGFS